MDKYLKRLKESREAYPERILLDCLNGKPCEYGICDECPNTLGNRSKEDE